MFFSSFNAQSYLYQSSGELKLVSLPSEINNVEKSQFYKIQHYILNEQKIGSHFSQNVSGKNNSSLNFNYSYVFPVLDSKIEYENKISNVWFLKSFTKQINNRLSDAEKEIKYNAFQEQCIHEILNINFNSIKYFERVPKSKKQKLALRAIGSKVPIVLDRDDVNFPIIIEPVTDDFEDRIGNKLAWLFVSFLITTVVFSLLLLWPTYDERSHKKIINGTYRRKDELKEFLNFFIPKKDHFITTIILDINIILFLVILYWNYNYDIPEYLNFLNWGGSRRYEVLEESEWWRLLTNIFIHGGFLHIVYNSIGFVLVALLLEPMLGRIKFLTYYLICGVFASVFSIIYYQNILSIGSSGAVFGLFGIIIYKEWIASKNRNNNFVLYYFGGYALISIAIGLTQNNVDNAAHIGGFLTGLFLGYIDKLIESDDDFTPLSKQIKKP
jgi:rhomboid protease GluP